MQMDDVRAQLSDLPQHAGTYRRAGDAERTRNPGYRHSVDEAFLAPPTLAGHQHSHVHRLAQLFAQCLDVRLDTADVRPIELAHVDDSSPSRVA